MKGGTLVVSRAVNNHAFYKKRFDALGFHNPVVTSLERDGLNSLIYDMKPDLVIMGARFYQCCTPFLMKQLKHTFPKIRMAAVSVGEYPADLAMYFILNGVNSYVTSFDGIDQWYSGLEDIRRGKDYISPAVVKRIDMRNCPKPAGNISDYQKQIILLTCNGYKDTEIAETLYITRRTVTTHKSDIFTSLNVRNSNELIRTVLKLGIVTQEGMYFYPKDFTINPLPKKSEKKRNEKIA